MSMESDTMLSTGSDRLAMQNYLPAKITSSFCDVKFLTKILQVEDKTKYVNKRLTRNQVGDNTFVTPSISPKLLFVST